MQGNRIGTDYAGTSAIANLDNGVVIEPAASYNLIGGTTAGAGNLISGNEGYGVSIVGGFPSDAQLMAPSSRGT